MPKFDFRKPVNSVLLLEELESVFGCNQCGLSMAGECGTVWVSGSDDEVEAARQIVDDHKPFHTTEEQRVMREWRSHVDTAQSVFGLEPGKTAYEEFIEHLQDSERMGEFLWLTWLLLNRPAS